MVQDVAVAIIEVDDLSKTFKVPVREQGLRALAAQPRASRDA